MKLRCAWSVAGVLLGLSALAGCAGGLPEAARADDGAKLLASCDKQADDPDVTSWTCGDLTAVETTVLTASDRDVAMAFDGFAASFGGDGVRRVDSVYARGDARHTAMRIEGQSPRGEAVEAQMVAVLVGTGVHLVTCSSRKKVVEQDGAVDGGRDRCGPVIAHLVQDLPGFRETTVTKIASP